MSRCNEDEEVVGGLMPLIVNVLENLDLALIENQQLQVELELCKDDNEQLVAAFEKEKTGKKKIEQRLFELEFSTDEEKQHYQQRIDSLANIVKMLELKSKNATDHCKFLLFFGLFNLSFFTPNFSIFFSFSSRREGDGDEEGVQQDSRALHRAAAQSL